MDDYGSLDGEIKADDLTWREQDILRLLGERLTNREIANQLHLAESTVKDYVGKILSKLYVKNRREAVERAKTLGLLGSERKPSIKVQSSLPAEPTPFVGRLNELNEIARLLQETRLITLTGPGGIGKSRLALKSAERAMGDYKDGCFFISLAPIPGFEHIVQTIAESLKFPFASSDDPQVQLLRYLKSRELLLVLDNFEHLLEGAQIVSEILITAPDVKVLVTSRERLNLQSETIISIKGLGITQQDETRQIRTSDAITLFVQSARKLLSKYSPTNDDLEKIENVCRFLGGMPLGIELAAAWLHILSVDEIVQELEKGLDILSGDIRDAPERHRSIYTVFDHSWSLLDQTEQTIIMLLSIFRGGFNREAAQQVTRTSLQILAGLVNKSFLSHNPDTGRFEIHEVLRHYTQEKLEKTPEDMIKAQESHSRYFAEFMQKKLDELKSNLQMQALAQIDADIENIRLAWRYCLAQGHNDLIWMFIYGLWHVYWIRWWNHPGMELYEEAVRFLEGKKDEDSETLRALAMALQAYFMSWLDRAEMGFKLAKESIEILDETKHKKPFVYAYDALVLNSYFLGKFKEHIQGTQRLIEVAIEADHKWELAFALYAASLGALLAENLNEAQELAEKNLALFEEIGDVIGSTMPLIVLGHVAFAEGNLKTAKGHYQQCLNLSEEVDFYYSMETASKYLGKVSISLGNYEEANKYLRKSLIISKEINFIRDIINLIYEYSRLFADQDNSEKAVELLAIVVENPVSDQHRLMEGRIRDSAMDLLSKLKNEIPRQTYLSALERGKGFELEDVLADLMNQ